MNVYEWLAMLHHFKVVVHYQVEIPFTALQLKKEKTGNEITTL